jgi:hypothetical protein
MINDSAAAKFETVPAELSGEFEPASGAPEFFSGPFAADVLPSVCVASAVGICGIVESVDASLAQPDRPLTVATAHASRSITAGGVEVRMK